MNITITAAVIVRNEERCIKKCLESLEDIFDEIIIVDTGSSDNTLNIIEEQSHKKTSIFRIKWIGDFSYARNFAISKSNSKYIFFIDGDEYLCTTKTNLISQIAKHDRSNIVHSSAFCPKIINHDKNVIRDIRRIFRNNGCFYYAGFVHEELRLKNGNEIKDFQIDINIHHDGYLESVLKTKKKSDRNRYLNKKNIIAEPENLRWQYFYYRDELSNIDPVKAYKKISKLIKINPDNKLSWENIKKESYTFSMLDLLARTLLINLNNKEELESVIEAMRKIIPCNSNSLYYELIYELLTFKSLAKKRVIEIMKCNHQLQHNGMIHSKGLHIDAALSFYLFESGFISQSERLLRSVIDSGFTSEMTNSYLRIFNIKNSGVSNDG